MRLAELNIGEIRFHDQGQAPVHAVEGRIEDATAAVAAWRARARQRAELAQMDIFERRDIGISEADVWRETRKAPWER